MEDWIPLGERAKRIIQQHGLFGLCESDGCLCIGFEIQRISVDVSCRKSGAAKPEGFYGIMIRICSQSLDSLGSDLAIVAEEVLRQVKESSEEDAMIRYTDFRHDSEQICVYCGKPRATYGSYLCEACKENPSAQHSDYSTLQPK